MSHALRDCDYLEHVRDAIDRIERYTSSKDETEFMSNELIQDGVIRNLEIIGEAVTKLSAGLKAIPSDVPWGEISGMRNRLIHGYISVNLEIFWSTVQKVIPDFLGKIIDIQQQLDRLPR